MKKVKLDFETQLHCVPIKNIKAKRIQSDRNTDSLVLEIRLKYSGLLSLAASILGSHKFKQYELIGLSRELYEKLDGKVTVEQLVLDLAENEKLDFLEARALIIQYLKDLMQRGLVVVVNKEDVDKEHFN